MNRIFMFGNSIPTRSPLEEFMNEILHSHDISPDTDKQAVRAKPTPGPFDIQSILSNRKKNAFTVVWADGTTTVVHCQPGDDWDDEKALAMCFTKKALGNKGNFNDIFNDALDNKRKIIPGGAGIVAESSEEPHGDPVQEVAEQLTFVFGDDASAAHETEKDDAADRPLYHIFTQINGKTTLKKVSNDKKTAIAYACELAENMYGQKPYYYRTWMHEGKLMIDFGSYSAFILIEGLTSTDWFQNQ